MPMGGSSTRMARRTKPRGYYSLEEKIDRGVLLFLKKKKQKDFCPFGTERSQPLRCKRTKVLWFFLSRKNKAFLPYEYLERIKEVHNTP
jgi:hypothetical protein